MNPTDVTPATAPSLAPWETPELKKVDIATGTMNTIGVNDDGNGPATGS